MTTLPASGLSLRLVCALLALLLFPAPSHADVTTAAPVAQPAAAISKRVFGKIPHGPPVTLYTLTNKNGMSVSVMDYGATIVSIDVPDRAGKLDDVVLGYDRFAPYLAQKDHFGATIGRYANRIAKGQFMLEKVLYQVPPNDGPNALHGGPEGFDRKMWNMEPVDSDTPAVRFSYLSKDGEEGFPGNLFVSVTFTLTDENELRITYNATTDKTTIVNFTNHSYFNLGGGAGGTILDEVLTLRADSFTPVDGALLPTGEIKPVAGTPYDFTQPTLVGLHLNQLGDKPLGYDTNYVLNKGYFSNWALAAVVDDPTTGRRMQVYTDQPGVQFYTGNFLGLPGRGEQKHFLTHGALCLETQHFPDSPHHDNFPSTVLSPGDDFKSTTVYAFSTY
jgi:aldose 1-epimerase